MSRVVIRNEKSRLNEYYTFFKPLIDDILFIVWIAMNAIKLFISLFITEISVSKVNNIYFRFVKKLILIIQSYLLREQKFRYLACKNGKIWK